MLKIAKKILSFIDRVFPCEYRILSRNKFSEPVHAGDLIFYGFMEIESLYLISNRQAKREIIFYALQGTYYAANGLRWYPSRGFLLALDEYHDYQDRDAAPLRKEVFDDILSERA